MGFRVYEDRFSTIPKLSEATQRGESSHFEDNEIKEEDEVRRSKKARKEKSFGPDFVVYFVEVEIHLVNSSFNFNYWIKNTNLQRGYEVLWCRLLEEAIDDKMNLVMGNCTWKLVNLPHGQNQLS